MQQADALPFKLAVSNQWRSKAGFEQLNSSPVMQAYAYFRFILFLGEDALARDEDLKRPRLRDPHESSAFEEQWDRYLGTKAGSELPSGAAVDAKRLYKATIQYFELYSLTHDPDKDEPAAVVFDTLNGMRTALEQLDHVRNSLFIRMSDATAKQVYDTWWRDVEDRLRQVRMTGTTAERSFLYDYLIAKGEKGRQGSISQTRTAAQFAAMTRGKSGPALAKFVREDVVPAMAVWPMVVRSDDRCSYGGSTLRLPKGVQASLTTIRDLSANPPNPAVLHYLTAHAVGRLSLTELRDALYEVERYLVRQLLAARPLSPLRSKFMDIMARVDGSLSLAVMRRSLRDVDWQADNVIRRAARTESAYGRLSSRQLLAIFRGIERHLSGAGALFFDADPQDGGAAAYTIEHIYPQDSSAWRGDLRRWRQSPRGMDERVHMLGNLAPVTAAHNSAVGKQVFRDKRRYPTVEGRAAPSKVNNWMKKTRWTADEIDERGAWLIDKALLHWPDATG